MANMTMPTLPQSPDLTTLYSYVKSLHYFIQNLHTNGLQVTMFSDAQISAMTDLSQTGKLFYDTDNNQLKAAVKNGSSLEIKEVTLT